MKKFVFPCLIVLAVVALCQWSALNKKYTAQAGQIEQLHRELRSLKKDLFYLQTINYSQYIRTKRTAQAVEEGMRPTDVPQ